LSGSGADGGLTEWVHYTVLLLRGVFRVVDGVCHGRPNAEQLNSGAPQMAVHLYSGAP